MGEGTPHSSGKKQEFAWEELRATLFPGASSQLRVGSAHGAAPGTLRRARPLQGLAGINHDCSFKLLLILYILRLLSQHYFFSVVLRFQVALTVNAVFLSSLFIISFL